MNVTKGLHNVLWTYGTNQVDRSEIAPSLTYFPGGDVVDAVSVDIYNEQLYLGGNEPGLEVYTSLVGTGEIFGISEFGQSFTGTGTGAGGENWDSRVLLDRIDDLYPRAAFAVAWYSSTDNGNSFLFALPDVAGAAGLLTDPLIDALD